MGHNKQQKIKIKTNPLKTPAEQAKMVRLTWIKAHIGLEGNKLADEYTKLGTIDDKIQIKTQTTYKEIKTANKEYVYHKW